MKQFLCALVLGLMFFATRCQAASMYEYDMASLSYSAPLVLLVAAPEKWDEVNGDRTANCRVLKVFQDNRADRKIDISNSVPIAFSTIFRLSDIWSDTKEVKPTKLLFFLDWDERVEKYAPILSGVKLIEGEKIWGYSQQMNPGPYSPVSQTPELIKLKPAQPYDEAALLQDLALSLDVAKSVRKETRAPLKLATLLQSVQLHDPKQWSQKRSTISQAAIKTIADNFPASQWWNFLKTNWMSLEWGDKQLFKDAFRNAANAQFLASQPEAISLLPVDSSPDRSAFAPEMRRLFDELRDYWTTKTVLQFAPKDAAQALLMRARSRQLLNLAKNKKYQFSRDDMAALTYTGEAKLSNRVLEFATQRFGERLQNLSTDLPLFHAIVAYYGRVKNQRALEVLAASTQYMRNGLQGTDYTLYQPIIDLLQNSVPKDDARIVPILLQAFRYNTDSDGGASRALAALSSEKQASVLIQMLSETVDRDEGVNILTLILRVDKTGVLSTVEALKRLVADNNNKSQELAIDIASYYPNSSLAPILLSVAQNEQAPRESRRRAIEGLGRMQYQAARTEIEKLSQNEMLDQAAAGALASIGTKESLSFLIPILQRPNDVAYYAVKAIAKITGQNFGEDYSVQGLQVAREWAQKYRPSLFAK